MVHALPQPNPHNERRNKSKEEGRNQKESEFNLGNTTSDAASW